MSESLFLFYCGGSAFTIFLAITGAVAGFSIIKIAQRAAPVITNSDVAAVTWGWAAGFGVGGLLAFIFLGMAGFLYSDYLTSGLYRTIAFAIIGTSAGLIGVKPMFQRLEALLLISERSS